LSNRRIGLVRKSRGNDSFDAGFTRGIGQFSRINAVARDDPENFRRLQIVDLNRDVGGA
jgi:hypothetical protein